MSTTTRPFVASAPRERATAFGLAAVVTLVLLAGMGGMADRQYEDAYAAVAPYVSPTLALNTVVSATSLRSA
ncbi:MAG: hypothetical protein U1F53_10180 [Burkholderiaceae bacterium]